MQSQWIDLYCQLGHQLSIVKQVCLAESCSEFRFICDKCLQFESHKNHLQVNLQEAELYINEKMQKYQELENYLSQLCNSLTQTIQQLQTVIKAQHSLDLNLSQSTQKHQLIDNIIKFDKKSDQINLKIQNISDTYIEEIKKLIELVNSKNQNNNYLQPGGEKLSIDYYIQTADLLKKQEKYIESIVFYKQATDIDQKNLICWRSLGDCHRLIKEFLDAIPYYDKALKIEQNDIPSLIGKGECLRMLQDYLESKLLYEQVLQMDEKNLVSRVGLGECLRHQGSFLEAIQQYDLALEIDQKNIDSLFGKGYCLSRINSFSEADGCYVQVLKINPNHKQSRIEHDICINELNKKKKSRQSVFIPNQYEPSQDIIQTEDLSNRGPQKIYHIYKPRGQCEKSEPDFGKSFQVLPDNQQKPNLIRSESFDRKEVLRWCSDADDLKKNGKYEEALKLYEKALEKYPNDIPSLNGKANCLRLLLKFPESLETLERALDLNRNCISLMEKENAQECQNISKKQMNYIKNRDILRAQGEYEKSIEFYDQALELKENHFLSLFGKGLFFIYSLAESLRCLGRYDESIDYYNKSLVLNEKDQMSLTGLGESLRFLKKYKEAQDCYEKALKIDKSRIVCLRGLCNCLRKQLQPKEALEVITRALTLYPTDENSLNLKGDLFQDYLLEICLKEIERKEKALKQRNNQ